MKKLLLPNYDDDIIANRLANNHRLNAYPLLKNNLHTILTNYTGYKLFSCQFSYR